MVWRSHSKIRDILGLVGESKKASKSLARTVSVGKKTQGPVRGSIPAPSAQGDSELWRGKRTGS